MPEFVLNVTEVFSDRKYKKGNHYKPIALVPCLGSFNVI